MKRQSVRCNCCGLWNIRGIRWKCAECSNFDLCSSCYILSKHSSFHGFWQINFPYSKEVRVARQRVSGTFKKSETKFTHTQIHSNVKCDYCKQQNIIGIRWKCANCADFDLCSSCYILSQHKNSHDFWQINFPDAEKIRVSSGQVKPSILDPNFRTKILPHDLNFKFENTALDSVEYYCCHLPLLVLSEFEVGSVVLIKKGKVNQNKSTGTIGQVQEILTNGDLKVLADGNHHIYKSSFLKKIEDHQLEESSIRSAVSKILGPVETSESETEKRIQDILQNLSAKDENNAERSNGVSTSSLNHPLDQRQSREPMYQLENSAAASESQDMTKAKSKSKCLQCGKVEYLISFELCHHEVLCEICFPLIKTCLLCGVERNGKTKDNKEHLIPPSENPDSSVDQVKYLKCKLQEIEESYYCTICMENRKNVVFLCGHGACASCAGMLKSCHMCRELITRKINLY